MIIENIQILVFFSNISKSMDRKLGRGKLTIGQLLKLVNNDYSFISTSTELPIDLVPYGRDGTNINRDNEFYKHMKDILNKGYHNSCCSN